MSGVGCWFVWLVDSGRGGGGGGGSDVTAAGSPMSSAAAAAADDDDDGAAEGDVTSPVDERGAVAGGPVSLGSTAFSSLAGDLCSLSVDDSEGTVTGELSIIYQSMTSEKEPRINTKFAAHASSPPSHMKPHDIVIKVANYFSNSHCV